MGSNALSSKFIASISVALNFNGELWKGVFWAPSKSLLLDCCDLSSQLADCELPVSTTVPTPRARSGQRHRSVALTMSAVLFQERALIL
jgi:hypothetical protein